ncbi:right-handed parallel beta-helix repeat-containing protein [Erythrobacter litoralis]|uniref:right-handed parallel beta-helix repeat-containing protein n=1 Tax=Erythrobacter litoralis TaxID=39960 RepID=UPI0024348715|nr:right-handed parallel beta-helix repeat-containing protein [Erythrobacter litoralis]MDG6079572.1 right-handed parallel beta-helix repeat-containing protein [Erythrobacter litoralis]
MDIRTILDKCEGGETVDLSDKTIESFNIRGYEFTTPVTLVGGRFAAPNGAKRAFRVNTSHGLHFESGEVAGDDRSAMGFLFQGCRDIAMRRMTLHGLKHGIAANKCDGFSVEGCSFHDLRIDAFRSGGSRRVKVLSNFATDFHPIETGGKGDHPDFIQFWPLHGSDNSEIEIIGNRFERGDGLPAQGIFVRGIYEDRKTGKPKRPQFGRVVVCSNVIDGGLRNGISISGVNSGQVTDNVVLSRKGDDFESFMRIERSQVLVRGNVAEKFIGQIDRKANRQGRIAAPDNLKASC